MCACQVTREAASLLFSTDAVLVKAVTAGNAYGQQVTGKDATRRSVTVIADADNTGDVYVTAAATTPWQKGVRLKAGAGLTLTTVAAVWVTAPTADSTVYVVAESGAAA